MIFKIYNHRYLINTIILFILFEINQILLSIIPEFIELISFEERLLFFIFIPIIFYIIVVVIIFFTIECLIYKRISNYIGEHEDLRMKLWAFSNILDSLNDSQIKEKIEKTLIDKNYHFKISDKNSELNFFMKFIKKSKGKKKRE